MLFYDIYIYAGSILVYTVGGGSNPFAGYCRGW